MPTIRPSDLIGVATEMIHLPFALIASGKTTSPDSTRLTRSSDVKLKGGMELRSISASPREKIRARIESGTSADTAVSSMDFAVASPLVTTSTNLAFVPRLVSCESICCCLISSCCRNLSALRSATAVRYSSCMLPRTTNRQSSAATTKPARMLASGTSPKVVNSLVFFATGLASMGARRTEAAGAPAGLDELFH